MISVLLLLAMQAGDAGAAGAGDTAGCFPTDGGTMTGGLVINPGSLTLSTGDILLTAGTLTLGLNQKLVLDDDLDSWIVCTADDSCTLTANGTTIMTWSGTAIGLSANTTAGVVALNFASASTFRIAANEAAVPAEPTACSTSTFGTMRAVNDTNDGVHSHVCYCGQLANDATYDWLIVGTTTACPFF